jgi:hypothetical protein
MRTVFIGGHPRSGTTLLGAMIGAHSQCICTPESQFKTRVLRRLSITQKDSIDISKAVQAIQKDWRFKIWGIDLHSLPYHEIDSYPELIFRILKLYREKFDKYNADIWIDHTPSNIKNANSLLALFPESKFIHIVRDGRGVAASIMPLDWGPNTIDKAARSWVKRISHYLKIESSTGEKSMLRIRFEDLVLKPAMILEGICNFLNIDYQPQMLQGQGFHVPQYTSRQHSLVGKAPDPSEVNAWERELKPRQVEIFENIAGELLISLGYQLKFGSNTKKMSGSEKLISNIQEIVRREIINKSRHRRRIKQGVALSSTKDTS